MEDLNKIQEFFSKPLEENVYVEAFKLEKALKGMGHDVKVKYLDDFGKDVFEIYSKKPLDDDSIFYDAEKLGYSNVRVFDHSNESVDEASKEEETEFHTKLDKLVHDTFGKRKGEMEESVNEMDMNDPVMMKMRAAKDKLAKMRAANAGDDGNDKFFDAAKLRALKKKRAQIMRDMEQEAEMEGGPVADKYGGMLNKIDKAISMLGEAVNEYDVYMPSQEEVDQFFEKETHLQTHYLNSKPVMGQEGSFNKTEVQPWDEYDYSNWKALVSKALEEYNTGIYYKEDNTSDKAKEAGDSALKKVKDMIQKVLKEEEGEDPIDTITMDIPLFIRVLEYAKEDAETDMDLHDLAEKAIAATKQQGMLSMDDYDMLVGELKQIGMEEAEEEGYSQYLKTDDNPEGKTKGLDTKTFNKILMNVIKDLDELKQLGEGVIEEELCPKGKAYIKKRQAAGEKSSAYLSGRAVKVCKGQMKG